MRLEKNGVPALVQKIEYHHSDMSVNILFFNGIELNFYIDRLCPSVGLLQDELTRMQELEVEQRISEVAKTHWKKWFPYLRIVRA